ncbi:MAG: Ig-like domain-containing protein [Elusimicrobiota bacterium]
MKNCFLIKKTKKFLPILFTICNLLFYCPVFATTISFFEVNSDSVTINVNVGDNPVETTYALKCIVGIEGEKTTYYLQADYTLADDEVYQTSSTWQNADGKWAVIVSTPNLPIEISVSSDSAESAYSNCISTWTRLVVPEAPTVIGCYEYGAGSLTGYFTKIFINSRNSKHTQYAIMKEGESSYLDGEGRSGVGKVWKTKTEWNKQGEYHMNCLLNCPSNSEFSFVIIATSTARVEESQESLVSGCTTPAQPFTFSTTTNHQPREQEDDFIKLDWEPINDYTNFTNYQIWALSPMYENFVFISSVTKSATSFNYDIDGSTPAAPLIDDITVRALGNTVTLSWPNVDIPTASPTYKYKIIAVADTQDSIYNVCIATYPQEGNGVCVTPIIKGYKVYHQRNNSSYLYSTVTSTQIIIWGLTLNTTHTFSISAISTDDLESPKISTSVYLSYLTSEFNITEISVSIGAFQNNMFVGVSTLPEITISFNKVIDTTTVNSKIYIKAISDNKNMSIPESVQSTLSVSENKTTIKLKAGLYYGYRYQLIIDSVTDLLGNSVSNITDFDTLYNLNIENKIVPKTVTYIEISDLISGGNGYMFVTENPQKIEIDIAKSKLGFNNMPVATFELNMYNEQGSQLNQFEEYITIGIGYSDVGNDGFVDSLCGDNSWIEVDSLAMWHLDEERRVWMKLLSTVDKVKKVVSARTKQLSAFALVGILSYSMVDVKVYPIPWIPEDNRPHTGTLEGGITFTGLPSEGEISIYTITGDLVRKLSFDLNDNANKKWDGKNQDGQDVASGVYLWFVKTDKNKKTGKLMVIR